MTVLLKNAEVDGMNIAYREAGDSGKNILLVHGGDPGIGPGSLLWANNLEYFDTTNMHAFAPDRPGFGWSDELTDPTKHTADAYVDFLEHFVDVVMDGRVDCLIGQSRGALFSTVLLMRRPDLAEKFVIANTNSLAPAYGATSSPDGKPHDGRGRETILRLIVNKERARESWLAECDQISNRHENIATRQAHSGARAKYLESFGTRKVEAMKWLEQESHQRDVFIFWGTPDVMTTPADAISVYELCAKSHPRVEMHVVNNCGHFPFFEYSGKFNSYIDEFINGD